MSMYNIACEDDISTYFKHTLFYNTVIDKQYVETMIYIVQDDLYHSYCYPMFSINFEQHFWTPLFNIYYFVVFLHHGGKFNKMRLSEILRPYLLNVFLVMYIRVNDPILPSIRICEKKCFLLESDIF